MANITAANGSVYQLRKWLGLNESPDGDSGLKLGEAALMRNFRVTREGHLQKRPGYAPRCTLAQGAPVRGLWSGWVNGAFHLLAACGGKVWDLDREGWTAAQVGTIEDAPAHFFGFGQKVYILTGKEYYVWDGTAALQPVEGYVPVVVTAAPPEGGGTLLERVNLLTGKRRAKYSPDGAATVFHLPESDIDEVLAVEGTDIPWTADAAAGTVTFETAPEEGVNTLVLTWRKGDGERAKAAAMRFSETYNGAADTRVFLYGDGTNQCIYSDLDETGRPSAEYFPDGNVIAVDSANTPITALIRHYDRLLAFKTDSAYAVQYDAMTLEDGTVTAAFYTVPLNRGIGCAARGQAVLVENSPRTLHGGAVYEWVLSSSGSRDERNARRVSRRVENTLSAFDPAQCLCFDDEAMQEYYIFCGDRAVVHNYGNDCWYVYDNLPVRCMARVDGELYFGSGDGQVMHLSGQYRGDDGGAIDARWESGAMDFGQDWKRKYSTNIWVSVKPERRSAVTVSAQSDRRSLHAEKTVAYSFANFVRAQFAHWSFGTNRKPQAERVRVKVRKFVFYKLVLSSCSADTTATVLAADIQVRYTGNVK